MHGQHEFSETFKNALAMLMTRVWFSGVCLVGWPFYLRGDRSHFSGRGGLTLSYSCKFKTGPNGSIRIGENCKINECMCISSYDSVIIGDNVPMASKMFITDNNHGFYCDKLSNPPVAPGNHPVISTVKIGGNVWIGEDACMLVGVEIGRGARCHQCHRCVRCAGGTRLSWKRRRGLSSDKIRISPAEYDFEIGEVVVDAD